jgi:hypothetical protein
MLRRVQFKNIHKIFIVYIPLRESLERHRMHIYNFVCYLVIQDTTEYIYVGLQAPDSRFLLER